MARVETSVARHGRRKKTYRMERERMRVYTRRERARERRIILRCGDARREARARERDGAFLFHRTVETRACHGGGVGGGCGGSSAREGKDEKRG